MNSRWFRLSSLAVALTGGLALTTGCVDNNASAFIRQVQVLSNEDCSASNDPSSASLLIGTVDPALTQTYIAPFLVGNQLVPRGNPDILRPETDRIVFSEVEVHVLDLSGGEIGGFVVPATGFADPGSGTSPGYGVVAAPVLDAATMAAGAPQVVVSVKVFGTTLGNIDIETAPFNFPINVGSLGCTAPQSPDDPIKGVCRLGQDDPPDCRCIAPNGTFDPSLCSG